MIEPNALYEMGGGRGPEPRQDQQDWLRAEQRQQDWLRLEQDEQDYLRAGAGDLYTAAIEESTATAARAVY